MSLVKFIKIFASIDISLISLDTFICMPSLVDFDSLIIEVEYSIRLDKLLIQ